MVYSSVCTAIGGVATARTASLHTGAVLHPCGAFLNAWRLSMRIPLVCKECHTIFLVIPARAKTASFCGIPCGDAWRRTVPLQRFWNKVQRCAHDAWCVYCCWPWLGAQNGHGYGKVTITIEAGIRRQL